MNKYGWLGTSDTSKDTIITVIGDSYIENIMNPISCNQGNKLKSHLKDYSFFEAGRSGVTFIEAMQISKLLDSTIHPKLHLIYVSTSDFPESSALNNKEILYNIKLLYYLYLRFPLFVDSKNKENHKISAENTVKLKPEFNGTVVNKLFAFSSQNYQMNKIVLVFHPGTEPTIINLANKYHIQHIVLSSKEDHQTWALNANDGHWSC